MRSGQAFLARLLISCFILLWPQIAPAAVVEGLYEVSVPVAGPGEEERGQALAQALLQTVVKISGMASAAEHPRVREAAAKAQQHVAQFAYVESAGDGGRQLRVSFVPKSLERLLQDAGLAVWGKDRPAVIAWIAIEQGGQRAVLGGEGSGDLVSALEGRSRERGLPLLVPLMDLTDSSMLSAADIWGQFSEPVRQASQRYPHDAVLSGRLWQSGGQWQGDWQLWLKDEFRVGQVAAASPEEALRGLVDAATEQLAARYAVAGGEVTAGVVLLEIAQVGNLRDYAAVSQYLKSLTPVQDAQPVEVQGDRILYRLSLRGSLTQLQEHLALGRRLQPELKPEPARPADSKTPLETGETSLETEETLLETPEGAAEIPNDRGIRLYYRWRS